MSIALAQAERPLVLALDVGSSSTRAMVYDAQGRSVTAMAQQQPYQWTTDAAGGVFTSAASLVQQTAACIDAVLQRLGQHAEEIAAVGCDTFWHNLLGLDEQQQPVTPLISWADTRPQAVMAQLRLQLQLEPQSYQQRTGCPLHASYWPAKLLWLRQHHPTQFQQVKYWLSFGDYLYQQFLGERRCSLSMASGTGLFNRQQATWDAELLSLLQLEPAQLSPLVNFETPRHGGDYLQPEYAARWPALNTIPWYPAVGDGASSNIGCGCSTPSQLAVVMGTSGAMRRLLPHKAERMVPAGGWLYHVDRARCVSGGAFSEGGNLQRWWQQTLNLADTAIEQALDATPPAAHGLTVLPFWAGERSLGWQAQARGTITGLSLHTTPHDLLRATLEGMAYRFAALFDILTAAPPETAPITQIIASGGVLRHNPAFGQLLADVLGRPITQSAVAEGSARGVAVLALEALGVINRIQELPAPMGRSFEPQPAHTALYQQARQEQQRLYQLMGWRWSDE